MRSDNGSQPEGKTWINCPALFLDLDGTVRFSKGRHQFIQGPQDVGIYPDVEPVLWHWRDQGFLILGVSNQGGVAFGYHSPGEVKAMTDAMARQFTRDPFHSIKECYFHGEGTVAPWNRRSLLRKPAYGMLVVHEMDCFLNGFLIDYGRSLLVGDRDEDRDCAVNAGIGFIEPASFFMRATAGKAK